MKENKKVLVTSAWPYASNVPHLGNLVGSLLSGDVFSRYYKIKGYDCLYVSGTDAHGTSIEVEAQKKRVSPEELTKEVHTKILDILRGFEVEFDNYTITTTKNHKDFVRDIYTKMEKNGYIFPRKESKIFCSSCNKFLADSFILGTCPKCSFESAKGNQCDACGELLEPEELIKPKCGICGKDKIESKETTNWYIDLPKAKPFLETYIKSHPEWGNNLKAFSLNMLKKLDSRAITRDLNWGIDAPFKNAEGKKIYVWGEAVLGYVSATIEKRKDWKDFWFDKDTKQVYCIGKDNIPFHTIIFPSLLIASGEKYHLPDQISATEYLNWEGGLKFSKSRNVGIYCDDALKLLPSTYWRFYLLYNRPENKDVNFSWVEFEKSINQVLIGDYVNLVNRVITLLHKYYSGKINSLKSSELNKEDLKLLEEITETEKKVSKIINDGYLSQALKEIMSLSSKGNAYLQKRAPWKEEKDRKNTIFVCANLVKDVAILLYPFVPSLSKDVFDLLNVPFTQKEDFWKHIGQTHGFICKEPKNILNKVEFNEIKEKYEKREIGGDKKMIEYEDFSKVDLRVGLIKSVEDVPGADKLYKFSVQVEEERTILAGLKPYYKKEELLNKRVIVVSNLKPKKLRGMESNGMVLAADDGKGKVSLLEPDKEIDVGSKIY